MDKVKLTRKDFLADLAKVAEGFRQQVEAKVDGFDPDPEAQAERRAQAADHLDYFARTYFPHYVQGDPSLLHTFLYERLPRIAKAQAGTKAAWAAPRGEAKSTITSQIFVIWCVVHGLRHYIPIIMDSFDQAATMIEAIKAELEANARLKMDFPDACGAGPVWNAGISITRNNIKIQAFGSGKRMRGLRHGPYRPDLVICDDLENDENVRSPEQRDKLETWLKKAVLKLGPADDTLDVIVIGTVLHYDSLLSRLLKNPLWEHRTFRAVIEWPNRMDLWDRWEEVLLNQGPDEADAFYQDRKSIMDEGAVVTWPARRPIHVLMKIRARDGHAAFDSELQNDPLGDDDAPFKTLTFWKQVDPEWIFFGAADPSLGKKGNGRDPSAILVGGFSRRHGILDLVEASVCKRLPDKIIEDIIAFQAKYHCLTWVIESVQFQEFFRTELVKRSAARRIPVPAVPVIPHEDKALRIMSLQPHVLNGLIRFDESHTTFLAQLRHWPMADHDDGPDCLEMLWRAALSGSGGFAYEPVKTGSGLAGALRRLKGCF